jgi:predicted component of type VI protein secretion system
MPKLIFVDKPFTGQVYEFVLEKTTVGRSSRNTLVIPDDSVSHDHCEIIVNGPEVIVRDLGSRNGTFINGARLKNQQSAVKSGQVIRFGQVDARVEIEPESGEDAATAITAVYAHGRVMRDQRRAASKNPNPVKTLATPGPIDEQEQTILIRNPPAPASTKSVPPPTPSATAPVPSAPKRNWMPLLIAAIGIGVVIAIWFLWGRK